MCKNLHGYDTKFSVEPIKSKLADCVLANRLNNHGKVMKKENNPIKEVTVIYL